MEEFSVSIVICSHRRPRLLKGAVTSLVKQTASAGCYELIVVDNDDSPNSEVLQIVMWAEKKISIRYLHEPRVGLSHARNAGGLTAKAEYIGFMDDDAKANPRYVEIVIQIIKTIAPDICGGPYYPFYEGRKPFWFRDAYGSGGHGPNPRFLGPREYLSGTNVIFRRRVLDQLGWFDTKLGMSGRKLGYGEETMALINAWKANPDLKVYYEPDLFVFHLVAGKKMSVLYQWRIKFKAQESQAYFWMTEKECSRVREKAAFLLVRRMLEFIFLSVPDLVFRDHRRYPLWQNYCIEILSRRLGLIGSAYRMTKDVLLRDGIQCSKFRRMKND